MESISIAEITSRIICSCVPALPAFHRHICGLKVKVFRTNDSRTHISLTSMGPPTNPRGMCAVDGLDF